MDKNIAPNAVYYNSNDNNLVTYGTGGATHPNPLVIELPDGSTLAANPPQGDSSRNIATTQCVQNAISGFSTDVFYIGSQAPKNTKLL